MQRKILWLIAFYSMSGVASAQTKCEGLDWKKDAETAFQCIGDYQKRISDLESAIAKLINADTELPLVSEDHSHEHTHEQTTHNHDYDGVPEGAILMFASSSTADPTAPCPQDWSLLQEATGRMPIGAGQPSLKLSTEFVREFGKFELLDQATGQLTKVNLRPHVRVNDEWQYYRALEVGGAERVMLHEDEVPTHKHEIPQHRHNFEEQVLRSGGTGWQFGGNQWFDTPPRGGTTKWSDKSHTGEAGIDKPHNNMPPYIGLYFCTKK